MVRSTSVAFIFVCDVFWLMFGFCWPLLHGGRGVDARWSGTGGAGGWSAGGAVRETAVGGTSLPKSTKTRWKCWGFFLFQAEYQSSPDTLAGYHIVQSLGFIYVSAARIRNTRQIWCK